MTARTCQDSVYFPLGRRRESEGSIGFTTRVDEVLAYTAKRVSVLHYMAENGEQRQVWIGVAGVIPRDGCELLSAGEGAYVNFLTLASNAVEYRAKLAGILSDYRLELQDLEEVRPFSLSDGASEEIRSIAEELEHSNNPHHVRYATFHTFPRVM